MSLPKFLQPYLPSYDIHQLEKNKEAVRRELIAQVLNLGDQKAVKWIFQKYSLEEIKDVLRYPKRGIWFYDSLVYWRKILDVMGDSNKDKKANFKLYPT